MSSDRITPTDKLPAAKVPRAAPSVDAQRLVREAMSAASKAAGADHKDAQIAALRARAEAAEKARDEKDAQVTELERQARVTAEAQGPGPFQPPIDLHPSATAAASGPRGERGEQGKPSSLVAQVAALLIATTGLVTALAAIWRPAPDTKAAESYAAIRDELVKQNKALQQNGDSDEARWNVIIGLFKATGVKVTEAPGTPKVEPLALEPVPLSHRVSPSSAPAIQVRDPLPPPVPSVMPVKLPKDLASLPKSGP